MKIDLSKAKIGQRLLDASGRIMYLTTIDVAPWPYRVASNMENAIGSWHDKTGRCCLSTIRTEDIVQILPEES